jgi:hypothetical protein
VAKARNFTPSLHLQKFPIPFRLKRLQDKQHPNLQAKKSRRRSFFYARNKIKDSFDNKDSKFDPTIICI